MTYGTYSNHCFCCHSAHLHVCVIDSVVRGRRICIFDFECFFRSFLRTDTTQRRLTLDAILEYLQDVQVLLSMQTIRCSTFRTRSPLIVCGACPMQALVFALYGSFAGSHTPSRRADTCWWAGQCDLFSFPWALFADHCFLCQQKMFASVFPATDEQVLDYFQRNSTSWKVFLRIFCF